LIQTLQLYRQFCPHEIATNQENPVDLKKYKGECESISQAFALVAEHGNKTLNRFRLLLE
jgi:hypothetical protein